jgi:hypothetical protein
MEIYRQEFSNIETIIKIYHAIGAHTVSLRAIMGFITGKLELYDNMYSKP